MLVMEVEIWVRAVEMLARVGGDMGDSHGEVFAEDFRLLLLGLSGVKNADSKPGGGQD